MQSDQIYLNLQNLLLETYLSDRIEIDGERITRRDFEILYH